MRKIGYPVGPQKCTIAGTRCDMFTANDRHASEQLMAEEQIA
jgi:hypothetical protein